MAVIDMRRSDFDALPDYDALKGDRPLVGQYYRWKDILIVECRKCADSEYSASFYPVEFK